MAVLPSPDKLSAVDVGRMMLAEGANPNIQLKRRPPYRDVPQDRGGDGMLAQGATPLLRAARGGDDKFVALLLEYKALVDLPSKEGITPLMAAAGVDYGTRVTRGRNRTDEGVLATHGSADQSRRKCERPLVVDRGAGGRGGGGGGAARGGAGAAAAVLRAVAAAVEEEAASLRRAPRCCSWLTAVMLLRLTALPRDRTGLPPRQSNAEPECRPEPDRSARRGRTRLRQVHRIPGRQWRGPDR